MFKKIALATALIASFSAAHATQYEVNAAYEKTKAKKRWNQDRRKSFNLRSIKAFNWMP